MLTNKLYQYLQIISFNRKLASKIDLIEENRYSRFYMGKEILDEENYTKSTVTSVQLAST